MKSKIVTKEKIQTVSQTLFQNKILKINHNKKEEKM
jgi:hypothetical protein